MPRWVWLTSPVNRLRITEATRSSVTDDPDIDPDVDPDTPVRTTRRARVVAVAATTATSLAAWLLMAPISGRALKVKQGADTATVGPVDVVVVSLLAGLAGWGLLALLERCHTERPLHLWTVIARCVLALSLLGPLVSGVGSAKLALTSLHLLAGGVLISLMHKTTPA
jgi:hypothetical protein